MREASWCLSESLAEALFCSGFLSERCRVPEIVIIHCEPCQPPERDSVYENVSWTTIKVSKS
jgi:hypothetical protein